MSGPEFPPAFDVPPINSPKKIDYGKNYDGTNRESVYRHGLHYSKREIVLLGSGDEETGLSLIADAMLAEADMDLDEETYRPYDDDIKDLVESANKH